MPIFKCIGVGVVLFISLSIVSCSSPTSPGIIGGGGGGSDPPPTQVNPSNLGQIVKILGVAPQSGSTLTNGSMVSVQYDGVGDIPGMVAYGFVFIRDDGRYLVTGCSITSGGSSASNTEWPIRFRDTYDAGFWESGHTVNGALIAHYSTSEDVRGTMGNCPWQISFESRNIDLDWSKVHYRKDFDLNWHLVQ